MPVIIIIIILTRVMDGVTYLICGASDFGTRLLSHGSVCRLGVPLCFMEYWYDYFDIPTLVIKGSFVLCMDQWRERGDREETWAKDDKN